MTADTTTQIGIATAKDAFPAEEAPTFTFKIGDASNTHRNRWSAASLFARWNVEGGQFFLYVVRFTEFSGGRCMKRTCWGLPSQIFPMLDRDEALDFWATVEWVPEASRVHQGERLCFLLDHTPDTMAAMCEWWTAEVAKLPQDNAAAGVVMRRRHRDLRDRYANAVYVYREYALLVLAEADVYRRFCLFAGVTPGHAVLDVACGVGTVGSLLMDRQPNTWNVYFTDASAKMIECCRDAILRRFGQPPDPQSRFQVANVALGPQRQFLKDGFGHPRGFDFVLASRFANHFTTASLRPLLVALLDLCAPGGTVVLDVPIPCRFTENILQDEMSQLTGGVLELDAQPIRDAITAGRHAVTKNSPTIHGVDASAQNKRGRYWLTDADRETGRRQVQRAVDGIPNALLENVGLEHACSDFHDDTAMVESKLRSLRDPQLANQSMETKRDSIRYHLGEEVEETTTGSVIRRRFFASVQCRIKKTS